MQRNVGINKIHESPYGNCRYNRADARRQQEAARNQADRPHRKHFRVKSMKGRHTDIAQAAEQGIGGNLQKPRRYIPMEYNPSAPPRHIPQPPSSPGYAS